MRYRIVVRTSIMIGWFSVLGANAAPKVGVMDRPTTRLSSSDSVGSDIRLSMKVIGVNRARHPLDIELAVLNSGHSGLTIQRHFALGEDVAFYVQDAKHQLIDGIGGRRYTPPYPKRSSFVELPPGHSFSMRIGKQYPVVINHSGDYVIWAHLSLANYHMAGLHDTWTGSVNSNRVAIHVAK